MLWAIRMSSDVSELQAFKDKVEAEISTQSGRDSGGDLDAEIKCQLQSLRYVKRLVVGGGGTDSSKLQVPGFRLINLPLDIVMSNNVALSHFIDFMTQQGEQQYVFCYLTLEGWRVAAEQQLSEAHLRETTQQPPPQQGEMQQVKLKSIRDSAINIYEQYLSEKMLAKLQIDDEICRRTHANIRGSELSEEWFDEIRSHLYRLLQQERFFPAFKRSQSYVRCLAELDLLKDGSKGDDGDDDATSSRGSSLPGSQEDLTLLAGGTSDNDSLSSYDAVLSCLAPTSPGSEVEGEAQDEGDEGGRQRVLWKAFVTHTSSAKDTGSSRVYTAYNIEVKRCGPSDSDEWQVARRYNDFHDLHNIIMEKCRIPGLSLPSKKMINNMNPEFLERRRKALNGYLQTVLHPTILDKSPALPAIMAAFLDKGAYDTGRGDLARRMDTLVNPLKTGVRNVGEAVKLVPTGLVEGVTLISDGIGKMSDNMRGNLGRVFSLGGKSGQPSEQFYNDSCKVGASLDLEGEENIPVRILLLLMDEVFDLKQKNQWLRRRIVVFLRQIIKATFGDMINRRIVEQVASLTSAAQVALYVRTFRDTYWPGGVLAEERPRRDGDVRGRTRLVTKAKMLAAVPDEWRHLVGNETSRDGVVRVFTMLQHEPLNRRLLYVLLEALLTLLFPDNKIPEICHKLHADSDKLKMRCAAKKYAGKRSL